jgi:hypothetical protein
VVTGHADLDEPSNQVPDVRIAAVSGIRVGDDEGAVVDIRSPRAAPASCAIG